MAVSTLALQSEDKYTIQAYARRQDEIYFYNKEKQDDKRRIEQAEAEIEKLRQQITELQANQKIQ